MVKCVVAGCPNRQVDGTGTGTGEILSRTPKRFFSFPTDPARVKVWLAALRETGKQDSIGEHLICEDHFLPEDISSSEVTSDAIPIMPPDLDGSLGLSSSWRVESSEEEEQCATGGCDYDDDDDDDEGGEGDAPAAAAEPSAQDLPQQDQFGCFEDPPPEEDAKKTSPPKKIEPNQLKKATKRSVVPLETLTVRFLELLQATPNRSVDLLQAAKTLQIRKHRLINITNVLHDISFIRMKSANNIKWSASWPISSFLSEYNRATELENKQENQAELENLELVEDTLNGLIKSCTQELFNMTNDFKNAAFAYITHEDIKQLHMFQEQTVIVIKAPEETKLEVSAAEEDSMQVYLKATKSPIMIGTCEVGSDDTVTSDPEDKSGVFSTLEESLIRTAELFTVEDEEHTSSGESESEAPTTLEHVETRKVSTGVRKSSGWKTLKEEDDKMGPRCQSVYCIWSGARKCGEIRERDREAVFKRFRQKMNNTQRKKYVVSLVDVAPGQNQGPILLRFRMEQRYHLIVKGQRMRVCKPMFLSTLGLSHRYVAGCMAGKQQEKTENVCWSTAQEEQEDVLKASLCSDLGSFVASTESQWFGV